MTLLQPTIHNEGGLFATHNMPCPVCRARPAVLNLNADVFGPCTRCQICWQLRRRPTGSLWAALKDWWTLGDASEFPTRPGPAQDSTREPCST